MSNAVNLQPYEDVYIFVPSAYEIIRISEGDGTNLDAEDEAEGYVDYVYYAQHGLDDLLEEVDGGQLMLRETVRDTYKSMLDAVPDVLGMAYGTQPSFIHLKKA